MICLKTLAQILNPIFRMDIMIGPNKTCATCGISKPRKIAYNSAPVNRDGLKNDCKICERRKWRERNARATANNRALC